MIPIWFHFFWLQLQRTNDLYVLTLHLYFYCLTYDVQTIEITFYLLKFWCANDKLPSFQTVAQYLVYKSKGTLSLPLQLPLVPVLCTPLKSLIKSVFKWTIRLSSNESLPIMCKIFIEPNSFSIIIFLLIFYIYI